MHLQPMITSYMTVPFQIQEIDMIPEHSLNYTLYSDFTSFCVKSEFIFFVVLYSELSLYIEMNIITITIRIKNHSTYTKKLF